MESSMKTLPVVFFRDTPDSEERIHEYQQRALAAEDECRKLRKELLEKNYELTQELVKNRFKKIN